MKSRIKQIRKDAKKTQTQFAESLGLTQNYICMVENGGRDISERTIRDICRIYNVNEIWLRTGDGEPYQEMTVDEKIAAYVGEVLSDSTESFRKRFLEAQTTWTPEMWAVLKQICESLQE